MNTELIKPVTLSMPELETLGKLLLNAWSAEYALRITPALTDVEYIKNALEWTLPQAYYSVSFSLRSVLLTLGYPTAETLSLLAAVTVLHKNGLYADTDLQPGFFSDLHARWGQGKPACEGLDIAAEVSRLTGIVGLAGSAHELHIIEAVGPRVYQTILDNTPAYLKAEFLGRAGGAVTAPLPATMLVLFQVLQPYLLIVGLWLLILLLNSSRHERSQPPDS